MTMDLGFLGEARALNDSVLIDRARVLRDPERTTDDELDEDFEYPDNPGDYTTVYGGSAGAPCLVGTDRRREGRGSEGGQTVVRSGKRVRWSTSAPEIQVGDIIEMTASPDPNSNPNLVGKRFRVIEADARSLAASQMVYVEDEWGVRAR